MRSLAEANPPMVGLAQDQRAKKAFAALETILPEFTRCCVLVELLPAVQSEFEIPVQSPPRRRPPKLLPLRQDRPVLPA
jgi:hypothetical protein